jgi:hypothetical protein
MANINRQRENYRLRLKRRRKEDRRLSERAAAATAGDENKTTAESPIKKGSPNG